MDDIELVDNSFFGVSAREAAMIDPQQRLLLELSWQALENSGQAHDGLVGSATGVFVGISSNDYARQFIAMGYQANAHSGPGSAASIAAK